MLKTKLNRTERNTQHNSGRGSRNSNSSSYIEKEWDPFSTWKYTRKQINSSQQIYGQKRIQRNPMQIQIETQHNQLPKIVVAVKGARKRFTTDRIKSNLYTIIVTVDSVR